MKAMPPGDRGGYRPPLPGPVPLRTTKGLADHAEDGPVPEREDFPSVRLLVVVAAAAGVVVAEAFLSLSLWWGRVRDDDDADAAMPG